MTSNYQYGNQLKALRKTMCENQTDFWRRFGVTQSRGSRFEQGLGIPPSIMILVELYLDMKVSDADLSIALQNSRQRPMANAPKAGQ